MNVFIITNQMQTLAKPKNFILLARFSLKAIEPNILLGKIGTHKLATFSGFCYD